MAILDHNGESEFPFQKEKVFEAMCSSIPTIKGMKIENADRLQGRIMVKAGVSLFSWGENIPIQLIEVSDSKTRVQITSSPKTGIMFGGAFDMGKNRNNIESILSATSKILSSQNIGTESSQIITNESNQKFNTLDYQIKKKKPWYKKTWVIIVGILIILIIIANLVGTDDNSTSSSPSSSKTETTKSKQWTVVYEFKGNGMKKSPVFELSGGNAKIKYKYHGEDGVGIGMFAVYVVEQGKDIMVEGGVPEVMTQSEKEDSESSIQKEAGRYYLNVTATGKWIVTVEEEK